MKVALVGNQNSGKTTLFNCLTGMNAKIGNWPGVTIEKKTGKIKGTKYEITDLPGIYSLSPYSTEEIVSRDYIFNENPDVIINIVDATSIERSLYLTTQLMELDTKVILALNMADILEKKGVFVDIDKLQELLGVKVIEISALKETGIEELINELNKEDLKRQKVFSDSVEKLINEAERKITLEKNKRFVAVKLLEREEKYIKFLDSNILSKIEKLEKSQKIDLEEIIATERYKFIESVKRNTVRQKIRRESITDKLDKIFLNKILAFPIFIAIMFAVYYLSVGVIGSATVDWIGGLVETLSEFLDSGLAGIGTSEVLISLIIDGIVAGVGAVLSFVPQLIILFLCISLLETTGYMSRIALLLDKVFRKIGLSGKSLIPFIVGSGCSVPGIMGTRIIENQDERELTTILTPFIPCSAKLPIIALFSGYFFDRHSGLVSASLYFFAIAIIILSAIIMKKFRFKNTSSTYISELPDYKLPSIKYVVKDVGDKVISFIKRAGSIILICSIVIWFLLSFSFRFEYGINVEDSMLAEIGKKISCVFYPVIGENSWGATVSTIQGLVAKEQVISSMSVIAGFAEDIEGNQLFGEGGMFGFFTAASAYAFMVFNLFSAPCFGAIGAMRRELGGTKKMLKAVTFQLVLAWCLGVIVYQVGSRLERGIISIADLIIGFIIAIIVLAVILRNMKCKNNECANCPYCSSCK